MQLGTREIRHIILNNQVVNSSRALHSLKHTVPKSHKNIAIHMVDHIRRLGVFPANYALDLGEFIDSNGNSYIDIVELNPISCSMCYVNNSIYADVVPEIGECQRQLMMGAEFCYDAIANPKNYDMLRICCKSVSLKTALRISIVARLGPLLIPSSLLVLEFPAPESASADSPPDAAGRRR